MFRDAEIELRMNVSMKEFMPDVITHEKCSVAKVQLKLGHVRSITYNIFMWNNSLSLSETQWWLSSYILVNDALANGCD